MNLLLISIDSLRLDFVPATNPHIQTPRFDRISRDICFVERCFSPSTATRPVHTSIFTGLYPFEHGILGQGYTHMRPCPHLFDLFNQAGYQVGAFSEAEGIFTGLDYASWIGPYNPTGISRFLHPSSQGKCLFLHYWSAHTPYGAADGKALGETAHLLKTGGRRQVIERYCRAVQGIFEDKVSWILNQIDQSQWCVILFSDHGESWTADELYHGQTLRNSVLRVPLYLHVPGTGNPSLTRPLVSLLDLFPTLVRLFGLPHEYQGLAGDLFQAQGPRYHMAQIHPLPSQDDSLGQPLIGTNTQGPQWALFDPQYKLTCDEKRDETWLEDTWGENRLLLPEQSKEMLAAYKDLKAQSACGEWTSPRQPETGAQDLLNQRLRDLGYLE